MKRLLIVWGFWGPYHYARFRALHAAGERAGVEVIGWEMASASGHYAYQADNQHAAVQHLNIGPKEYVLYPWSLTRKALPAMGRLKPDVALLPSYFNWSLYLNMAARLHGVRVVMMNESHAGTEKATGWKRWVKRQIVKRFHAGFVGGSPHARHFANLGLPSEKLFPGYDAVDNAHFTRKADAVGADPEDHRQRLSLPRDYFLSLGRMVQKKNLPRLLEGFLQVRQPAERPLHLVFVGSGELEPELRHIAGEASMPVVDHLRAEGEAEPRPDYDPDSPAVHFYGFRQIDENPVFYALARAFILPSIYEEWGLVVNEAMASGLPVIVSKTAGCAEDLVTPENGFHIDPGDTSSIRDALQTLTDDPEKARSMAVASKKRIQAWGLETFADNALKSARAAVEC